MIECKDCKIFSQQIEESGICPLDNFGIYKLNHRCKTGEIINSVYRRGRKNAIDELVKSIHPCNECPSYKYDCDNTEYFEDTCKTEKSISWNELRIVAEELKEQNNERDY